MASLVAFNSPSRYSSWHHATIDNNNIPIVCGVPNAGERGCKNIIVHSSSLQKLSAPVFGQLAMAAWRQHGATEDSYWECRIVSNASKRHGETEPHVEVAWLFDAANSRVACSTLYKSIGDGVLERTWGAGAGGVRNPEW